MAVLASRFCQWPALLERAGAWFLASQAPWARPLELRFHRGFLCISPKYRASFPEIPGDVAVV
jgi:hypothetical protein